MTQNISLEEKIRLLKFNLDRDNDPDFIDKLFDIYISNHKSNKVTNITELNNDTNIMPKSNKVTCIAQQNNDSKKLSKSNKVDTNNDQNNETNKLSKSNKVTNIAQQNKDSNNDAKSNKVDTIHETKNIIKKVNKNDGKYIVLLKLINKILTNLQKDNITDLTEFINIDRDDLIKEENVNAYQQMEKELFKHFDKAECGWYRRNRVEYYLLTFLRYACEKISLDFNYIQKNKAKNNFVKTHIIYTIK